MIETFLGYRASIQADNKINKKQFLNRSDLLGIKIENLEYINKESNKIVINKLNLDIKPGELFAILGESGAGKTTLIDLICDIEQPTSGAIKFIDKFGNQTTRPEMAYVPQSPFIVAGDIYHNIAFGSDSINKEEINNLINILNLGKVAQRLNAINFEGIFEEGNNLSGGEKQRIGIARSLYSEKNFIILDEPTSALDPENQEKFINLLKELKNKKTIVVVTHNSNLAQLADQQIILPNKSN
jgi:ABC-type bacteriocin/lantibiotic exporter with double-glycine peptidase domain